MMPASWSEAAGADFLRAMRLLPEEQVARLCGYTMQTVEVKRCRGEMPPTVKIGQLHFYPYDAIMEWAQQRSAKAISDDLLGRRRKPAA